MRFRVGWSGQWADVLIGTEEIVGIILGFDLLKAAVVGAVSGSDWLTDFVVTQVIHIAGVGEKRLHRRICCARPGYAALILILVQPLTENEEIVARGAMGERR